MGTIRKRTRKSTGNKRTIIAAAILVLIAVGATAHILYSNNGDRNDTPGENRSVTEDRTRQEESEGSTFEVPDNVPKDAIKNYELITENELFKIRKDRESESYLITLYAIINRPDQYDLYRDQLSEYKNKALQYLREQGVDTQKAEIEYEPKEASNL